MAREASSSGMALAGVMVGRGGGGYGEKACALSPSHISFGKPRSDLKISGTDSKALAVLSEQ